MKYIIYSLFTFLLFQSKANAQVNFYETSTSIEKTIKDVGYHNMQTAWIVTDQDTLFTYHFSSGELVSRTTPFDSDSKWVINDSLYHKYESADNQSSYLVVYFNSRMKRQVVYKFGKLQLINHWQHDSLGKEILHKQWRPSQVHTTVNHPNGMQEWIIEDQHSDSKTIRKKQGDTNRVWSMLGKDTTSHRFNWDYYSEVKRYKPLYITRNWSNGIHRTQCVRTEEMADSSIIIEKDDSREMWQYQQVAPAKNYNLYLYSKLNGLVTLKSTYQLRPESDTAKYTWETYGLLENGYHRKIQVIRLKKDSSRYKQIDYKWKDNGEIDYLKITNRWGFKRKKKPDYSSVQLPVGCATSVSYQQRQEKKPIRYRFDIVTQNTSDFKVQDKNLKRLIYQELEVEENDINNFRWIESLLFELDDNDVLRTIAIARNSALFVGNLRREIGQTPISLPADYKTVFYYKDVQGLKKKVKLDYVLLPVEVLIRER